MTPKRKCWCGERHDNHPDGHHCYDWDYMYIREHHPEYEACVCGYKQPERTDTVYARVDDPPIKLEGIKPDHSFDLTAPDGIEGKIITFSNGDMVWRATP